MTLHLHRAPRTDLLADELAGLLAEPLADPFADEVVVVPAKGVERWLSQRLSHRLGAGERGDGVCAGVDFRSPRSLVGALLGSDDDDPWAPDALTWPLLRVVDDSLDEPWAATLARHLGHGDTTPDGDLRRGRRYGVAQRLARLFSAYAVQRPTLLAAWSAGEDTDGIGGPIAEDLRWQPELWRRLAAYVAGPTPAERHAATLTRLRETPDAVDLPERLSLFGHTRLSVTEVELLAGLGAHREVHLWLPHPSAALWSALEGVADGPVPRADDRTHELVSHPLLAGLGRDTRELQRTLAGAGPALVDASVASTAATSDNLLGWLQADLRANTVGSAPSRTLDPADDSVQVHACHGPARQVEVLREVLLGLLADDPTLEPRDVLVMCPDIESYAPLLAAAFGLGDEDGAARADRHPGHRLRVKLADRALDQTNPLLGVLTRLLDLAGGRAGVGEVLDLAHLDPVRRRFRFRDDDLQQIAEWAREAGIRWGFDAEHRREFGLHDYVANTWEFGLDRLLAGVTMSQDAATWLDRTLPLDDVGSGEIELVGRLTEFVHRLRSVTDRMVGAHPLTHWLRVLHEAVGDLTDVPSTDVWQVGQVQRELGRIATSAEGIEGGDVLRLPDVRGLLRDRFAGRPTRANFRTGTLTICTMVPMRSVPHRVVALLGLDDGVFPRTGFTDGDDVLARRPVTGERDPRSEDRQLFLDAILSATDKLVITYTGANEYSGQPRPPAPPLGELLDALDITASTADGAPVSRQVAVRHPLQPYDARAFTAERPFSFDRRALAGARAAQGDQVAPPPLLPGDLSPVPTDDVALEDLLGFWSSPVRAFFRDRVDVALPRDEEPLSDGLPVEIDSLAQWSVGDRVLHDLLRGLSAEQAQQQEWRRGALPPGWLGWRVLGEILQRTEPLVREARALRVQPPRSVDVDVDLGGGRRLRGTVPEVYGERLVPVTYSRLAAKHRLRTWIQLLALTASDEDHAWSARALGRGGGRSSVLMSQLGPLDHTARATLRTLVELRDVGLCRPLPFPLKSSLTYARQRRTHAAHEAALARAGLDWRDDRFPGEQSDAEQVRAWGPGAELPGLGPVGPGIEPWADESTELGALALQVWSPLIQAEQGSW